MGAESQTEVLTLYETNTPGGATSQLLRHQDLQYQRERMDHAAELLVKPAVSQEIGSTPERSCIGL